MFEFLTKYRDFNTSDAIKKVIESQGKFLILGYGYITPKQDSLLLEYFKILNRKMLEELDLEVEIHVGLLFNWDTDYKSRSEEERRESFISDHQAQVTKKLKEFDNFNFDEAVKERIKIYGIPHMHAKFCLNVTDKIEFEGVSGAMGSSNLTNVALFDWDRTELDLFMGGNPECEVLKSFSSAIRQLYEENKNQKYASYCLQSQTISFHESQAYIREMDAMHDAQKEYEREEGFLSMYPDYYGDERVAIFESDRDLEVCYDTEENLKKYYR